MYIKDRETPLILTSEFNKFERNRWGLNGTESRRQRYVDRANFCARVFTQYWNQNPVVFFFFLTGYIIQRGRSIVENEEKSSIVWDTIYKDLPSAPAVRRGRRLFCTGRGVLRIYNMVRARYRRDGDFWLISIILHRR